MILSKIYDGGFLQKYLPDEKSVVIFRQSLLYTF